MNDSENPPPRSPSPVGTTPRIHRHGVNGLSVRSKDQQQRFAYDIEWKIVGPMPTAMFLDKFFPNTPDPGIESEKLRIKLDEIKFASVPDSPNREEEMYEGLCADLNKIADPCGFIFCDISRSSKQLGVAGTIKPDIGLYAIRDENKGYITNFHKPVKGDGDGAYTYLVHMGLVQLFIEVKKGADQDIFTDPLEEPPPPDYRFTVDTSEEDEESSYRISALGQNAHYARMVQTRQFRTCVFSLTISGSTARMMRWDRSGVLVTEAFDYKENPRTLIEFVWRFIKAKPAQQGFDPTAVAVDSKEDRDSFLAAIRSHVQLQLDLDPTTNEKEFNDEVNRHYDPETITRLMIGNHDIWVSRPLWLSHAIVGRCTAGYWGVRSDTQDVVFVKDVWRTNVKDVELEGDILKGLQEKGVEHIPTVLSHGDAANGDAPQTTRTDEFTFEPWVKSLHPQDRPLRKITRRVHYRLVTNTAGYPLSFLKGSRELLKGTFGGFTALVDAHEKADTIHRDVALGNIILARLEEKMERVGYLVDWELSCKLSNEMAREHALTGTPAFMSIKVLTDPEHAHTLEDDLESLIYVILYAALRWLPVKSKSDLSFWLTQFFGAPTMVNPSGGGLYKLLNASTRFLTSSLSSTESPDIVGWLRDAMDLHYENGKPNPSWKGGKELGTIWKATLAKALPSGDRCVNEIPNIKLRGDHSLHATYTVNASSGNLYRTRDEPTQPSASTSVKRPHTHSVDDDVLHTTPPPKRRWGEKQPQTRGRPRTRSTTAKDREQHRED